MNVVALVARWFNWVLKARHEHFIAHFGVLFLGKNCCSFDQFFWKLLYYIVNLKKIANYSVNICKLSENKKIKVVKKKKKKPC
jgi:hypothetical protein